MNNCNILQNLIKALSKHRGNGVIWEIDPNTPENFLLTAAFYFLWNREGSSQGSIRDFQDFIHSPGYVKDEANSTHPPLLKALYSHFPFNRQFTASDEVIGTLRFLCREEGQDFPPLIHEYFLENHSPDGVRKKQGIFYTPRSVARYILEKSLEPFLGGTEKKLEEALKKDFSLLFREAFDEVSGLKILDPACGWGIFLAEAYDRLEKFYRKAREISKGITGEAELPGGNIGRHILEKNILGYDIDETARKIAGFLLMEKAGIEPGEVSQAFFPHVYHRNFIYDFQEIDKASFDLVIGNPPYFTIGGGGKAKAKTDYHSFLNGHPFFGRYFRSQSDIFYYFILGGIEILKPGGILSFIAPSYWLENQFADSLRGRILEKCIVEEITRFEPVRVFMTRSGKPVNVDTAIFRLRKKSGPEEKGGIFPVFSPRENGDITPEKFLHGMMNMEKTGPPPPCIRTDYGQDDLSGGKWILTPYKNILTLMKKDGIKIFPLGDIPDDEHGQFPGDFNPGDGREYKGLCSMGQGQETGLSEVFTVSGPTAEELGLERELLRPNLKNSHIQRYHIDPQGQYIIMPRNQDDIDAYPRIKDYLLRHREALERRQRVQKGVRPWYAVSIPQNYEIFNQAEKIVTPYRSPSNRFAIDRRRHFNDGGDVRGIVIKEEFAQTISHPYLLALLNSALLTFWYIQAGKKKGNMLEYFTRPLSRIPIAIPGKEEKEKLESLVEKLTALYEKYYLTGGKKNKKPGINPGEFDTDIKELEARIDGIVFDLYSICSGDRAIIIRKVYGS